ncbi:tumor necrosis factor ligand superfamily member 15-like [Polypterus senegalus]|uniref:tumor necrosis factor ligand superfamily member 15-like n=1 Tax=Polypterus senegalus TaxID=55291 RepID=UPI001966C2A2|nr:tumor necrosis factor ligand superfamily member 15-like [Polypterus senegalus]
MEEEALRMSCDAQALQLMCKLRRILQVVSACLVAFVLLLAVQCFLIFHMHNSPQEPNGVPPASGVQGPSVIVPRVGTSSSSSLSTAHVTAVMNDRNNTLSWEPEQGYAFTKGIRYQNKALVIPSKGEYYVYAQILFYHMYEEKPKARTLSFNICKETDKYPEKIKLLTGVKTMTETSKWIETAYIGAVLSLDKDDKLTVDVGDYNLIDLSNESKTFFGAFQVSIDP